MPIANLTTNIPKAFMKLGHIRKGEKVTKEFTNRTTGEKYTQEVPVDLDYFRVTFQPGVLSDALSAKFREVYGPKPTEINIRFADSEISEVWDANYECYKQGGLIAKAGTRDTGPYWIFYRDPETSEVLVRDGAAVGSAGREFFDKPLDLDTPIYYNSKKEPIRMEPVGRLQVVIPELASLAVGFFTFQPISTRDIRNITAELGAFEAIAKSYGKSITGVPFKLVRREEEITKNIKGKLSKGPSWVVHLDAGGEWGRLAIETIERLALPDVIEANYTDVDEEEDFPSEPEQTEVQGINTPLLVAPAAPAAFVTYDMAKQVIVHVKKQEKLMGELNHEQLLYIAKNENGKMSREQIEAAKIILEGAE